MSKLASSSLRRKREEIAGMLLNTLLRRVFQYKRTYCSRRTGPRDQALWWEQTKEDAGDASHLSTSMLINFPLHLRLARTCKKQHSNFKFYSWYRGATRNGKHSTEERPMPEMSGNLTQTLALLFTFWMVNFDIFCQHLNVLDVLNKNVIN